MQELSELIESAQKDFAEAKQPAALEDAKARYIGKTGRITMLMKELGKDVKRTYCHEVNDEELRQLVIRETYDKVYAEAKRASGKQERTEKLEEIAAEFCTR